jgi:rhodanese-related sulfurtransferase
LQDQNEKAGIMRKYAREVINNRFILFAWIMLFSMHTQAEYSSPEHVEGSITISVEQAKALYDRGVVFIDVRNPRLYAGGHIVGAHHLDLKNGFTEAAVAALVKRDQPVIIYCSGVECSRSYRASAKAVSWGFEQVHYFRGGIVDWKNAGYPVTTDAQE